MSGSHDPATSAAPAAAPPPHTRVRATRSAGIARALACLCLVALAAAADPWLTGFYQNSQDTMTIAQIPWDKYTHIIHFAAAPNADGTIDLQYLTPTDIRAFIASRPAGKQALVIIGDKNFRQVTSPAAIGGFVANVVSFVTAWGYDGVDYDWESSIDVGQYDDLLRRTRAAMPGKVITIDVGNWGGLEQVTADSQALVDQANVMCYDMDYGQGHTWYDSALMAEPGGDRNAGTCEQRIRSFISAGVARAKLGVGVPFYCRRWTNATGPLQSSGTMASSPRYGDLASDPQRWQDAYQRWDSTYHASYLSVGPLNEFISFNGVREMQETVAWMKQQGFGGIMTYGIDYEFIPSASGDARFPLTSAIRAALGGSTAAPAIGSFAAAPSSIVVGSSSTLSWSTTNASSVSIGGVGAVAASGSVAVSPTATTTYTLTASGGGSSVTASATVTVTARTAPPSIGSFTANPSSIASGASAQLSWSTANATSVSLSGVGAVAASGSITVTPAATTTYTLSASGGGSTVTASAAVTVTGANPGPIVSGHTYKVIAEHSGECLDVTGGSADPGANVQQWSDDGGPAQRWRVDALGDGSYTLTAACSGDVLDVAGGSTTPGGNVIQWPLHGGANQRWRIAAVGGGWCVVTNVNSGEALDVQGGVGATQDGANVEQWPWQDPGADNERWRFVDVDAGGIVSGQWCKLIAKHSGKCLAVTGSSADNAANVWQWVDDGTTGEIWRLDAVAPSVYTLTARCSGQALDMAAGSLDDGGNAIQWPLHGGTNQQWRFEDQGGGFFRITNVNSGKALDVAGISAANGANVQQWTWWGGDNQLWTIAPVAPSAVGSRERAEPIDPWSSDRLGALALLVASP